MTRSSMDAEHHAVKPVDLGCDFGLFAEPSALPDAPAPLVRTTMVSSHRRTLEGPPLPSEAERRDAVLQSFEDGPASRRALVYVRAKLLELYRRRRLTNPECYVTADDAHDILDAWADYPRDDLPSNNWRGSIFRGSHWKRTGETIESKRNHGTALPCWAVVGDVR